MNEPHIRWVKGGDASVVLLDGDRITVSSAIPSAPGSPLDGALVTGRAIRIKVARCRKQEECFLIEGRLIDATREVRAEIDALVRPHADR